MLQALSEEKRPVTQAAEHYACVYEVEVGKGKGQWLFDIVNLVFDIWGGPTGLDRGEIDAIDLGLLKLLLTLEVLDTGMAMVPQCQGRNQLDANLSTMFR